jgi:hypothetical protein
MMSLQLKGFLLIMLMAGYEANRVNHKISINQALDNFADDLAQAGEEASSEAADEAEMGDWDCDYDVQIAAKLPNVQHPDRVRIQKDALVEGVRIGTKDKADHCTVAYSLLCRRNQLNLRKELLPCAEQHSTLGTCEKCGDRPKREHAKFNFFQQWRQTEKHSGENAFKFDVAFNKAYASNSRFPDGLFHTTVGYPKVSFTPQSQTCEDVYQQIKTAEEELKESLTGAGGIADMTDKKDFRKQTALMKPFHKAKMLYDKMGCETGADAQPVMEKGFRDRMVANLKEVWVSHYSSLGDKRTARRRFDTMLAFVSEKAEDASLKDLVDGMKSAFGIDSDANDGDEEGISEEDCNPENEDALEEKLASSITGETNSSALVQVDGDIPASVAGAAAVIVCIGVAIGLFVLFLYIAWYLFVAALIISLGILSVYAIQQMIKR